jgi:hypothetical protein
MPAVGPATVYSYTETAMPAGMSFTAPAPVAPPRRVAQAAPQPEVRTLAARAVDPGWAVPMPGVAPTPSVLSWSQGFENIPKRNPPSSPPPTPAAYAPQAQIPAQSETPNRRLIIETISPLDARASANAAAQAAHHRAVEPPSAPVPFVLWPFAAVDWICGNLLAGFGPAGRWLGKGGGKYLFGWAGLFMSGGAIAWAVMDYFGWSL